jgi:hypothetical protein
MNLFSARSILLDSTLNTIKFKLSHNTVLTKIPKSSVMWQEVQGCLCLASWSLDSRISFPGPGTGSGGQAFPQITGKNTGTYMTNKKMGCLTHLILRQSAKWKIRYVRIHWLPAVVGDVLFDFFLSSESYLSRVSAASNKVYFGHGRKGDKNSAREKGAGPINITFSICLDPNPRE